jgi:hypothetical protein
MGHHFALSDEHYLIPGQGIVNGRQAIETSAHEGLRYSVKREPASSRTPELPLPASTFQQYQFQFRSPVHPGRSGGHQQVPSTGPLYRFGSESPLMSNSWPSSSASSAVVNPNVDLASMQHTMSFHEYEDTPDELTELPAVSGLSGRSTASVSHEKTIRRRSSKGTSLS